MATRRLQRSWLRRAIVALCLSAAAQVALLLVPWWYLWIWTSRKVVMHQHMTVAQQGEWYWNVTVVETLGMRTLVTAKPWDNLAGAQRSVAMAYDTLSGIEMPNAPGKVVLRHSDRIPLWADFSGHDPTPYRNPWKPEASFYTVRQDAIGHGVRSAASGSSRPSCRRLTRRGILMAR